MKEENNIQLNKPKMTLTDTELKKMRQDYSKLQEILINYPELIYDKKKSAKEILEMLGKLKMQAEHLISLGKAYESFISDKFQQVNVFEFNDKNGIYLNYCLTKHHAKTLDLIVYLLSRCQKDYQADCIYYDERLVGYSNYRIEDRFDLLVEKTEWPQQRRLGAYDTVNYLETLYEAKKSFLISYYNSNYNDSTFKIFHDELLSKHRRVTRISYGKWETLCFIADTNEVFKEVIMKLMLFSEIHGLDLANFNNHNKEKYAQAIESMDISSWDIEKEHWGECWGMDLRLVKRPTAK